MPIRRTILAILLFTNITFSADAQESGLEILCNPKPDSIQLRWAPTSSKTWRLGNTYGYKIIRYTVLQDKKIPKEIPQTLLTPEALKPVAIEEWQEYADEKMVAIAAECIYGATFKGITSGGNPHIAYKKYNEEQHRYSFALYAADQSMQAAILSGLYFADKTAKENEKYLYKVYLNTPDSIPSDTASVFTGISEYKPLPKPQDVQAEWGDKQVKLSWNIVYQARIYNSYFVEKSTDGGKNYTRISENASIQVLEKGANPSRMYSSDSLTDNTTEVYYQVRGVSAFGEISPPSLAVSGTGTLPLENAPVIISQDVIENKEVLLSWEYPENMNAYISGFKLYRSSKPKGRKQLVYKGTDPKARSFRDTTAEFNNYYLISVYTKSKENISQTVAYAQRIDSFPPESPQKLWGAIDTNGVVGLRWQANTDSDIHGYRVYKSNTPYSEFILAYPSVIEDTVFYDSINLKTLTKNIYYKVRAIDERQNQSEYSDLLSLTRPDIIPPISPVVKKLEAENKYPAIEWVNSSSDDVIWHHIFRRIKGDSINEKIESIAHTKEIRTRYTDKNLEAGREYIYTVVAEDEAGLYSKASNPKYYKSESGITESIKLKKKVTAGQVKLNWTVKAEKEVKRVLIYRSVNGEALRLYSNTETEEFIDGKLKPETGYSYAIKLVYTDGSTSALSNTIKVKM